MTNDRESPIRVADGFLFTEGPTWVSRESEWIFNDIPAAQTFAWDSVDGLRLVRDGNGKANGTTLDAEGRLLVCEHATSRLVRYEPDGSRTVLADHFEGRELNSPNDVIVASDGAIFFTDPPFGRALPDMGVVRERELDFAGVYSLLPSGSLLLLTDRCAEPNGLCLTADESELFVNDTASGEILRFSLRRSGDSVVVDDGEVWAVVPGDETGSVDGLKFDRAGRLHCTGPGGILVFDGEGRQVDLIEIPEKVGNFAWGGADGRAMLICASTSVYVTRTLHPGLFRG